ncbi:MAG: IPTL-CTERM sorting domain-containing protein [Phycisphaerae bacterium]
MKNVRFLTGLATVLAGATIASAATVPFVEDFDANASQWFNGAGNAPASWLANGGPDGSAYISEPINLAAAAVDDTPIAVRGQVGFGSSGGAFAGNYIAEGVTEFRTFVRHDAPFPLTFYARFAGPGNFPGAIAVNFVPVFPNQWTEVVIPIDPNNPQFISFEGTDFGAVFNNVGNIQIGVSVAEGQAGFPFDITVDVDQPQILGVQSVPTVSTWGLVVLALMLAVMAKIGWQRQDEFAV